MVKFRNWCGIGFVVLCIVSFRNDFVPVMKIFGRELSAETRAARFNGDPVPVERMIRIRVTFKIDPDYHKWGGYLSTYWTLPYLAVSVTADGSLNQRTRGDAKASLETSWDLSVHYGSDSTELTIQLDETAYGWAWFSRSLLGTEPIIEKFPVHREGLSQDWIRIPERGGWLTVERLVPAQ